jgi:hypothetical protein
MRVEPRWLRMCDRPGNRHRVAQNAGPPGAPPGLTSSQQTPSQAPPAAVPSGDKPLPQINVQTPKRAPAKPRQSSTRPTNRLLPQRRRLRPQHCPPPILASATTPEHSPAASADAVSRQDRTKLEDLPTSVQIINRDVVNQGGGAVLDTITNASGIVGRRGHALRSGA